MEYTHSKRGLQCLLYAIIIFFLFAISGWVILFEGLYGIISYGLFNEMYHYFLRFGFLMTTIVITTHFFKKRNIITFEKKSLLTIKKILILYALVLIPIIIISGALGWEFKPIYDLGERFTGKVLYGYLAYLLFALAKTLTISLMLYGFQNFINESIKINFKHSKFIPLAGIMLMLTFGLFELIAGTHDFWLVYLLFNIYFGVIFTITDDSVPKSYLLITLLYFL